MSARVTAISISSTQALMTLRNGRPPGLSR
nr:MAG TPA: hypothetical protein [Caudoviricetes sp.]